MQSTTLVDNEKSLEGGPFIENAGPARPEISCNKLLGSLDKPHENTFQSILGITRLRPQARLQRLTASATATAYNPRSIRPRLMVKIAKYGSKV
jgi:hypothetical protein